MQPPQDQPWSTGNSFQNGQAPPREVGRVLWVSAARMRNAGDGSRVGAQVEVSVAFEQIIWLKQVELSYLDSVFVSAPDSPTGLHSFSGFYWFVIYNMIHSNE